ncbi:hypothetical protein BDV06DRAFT_222241 [Aspergillus oleicola]
MYKNTTPQTATGPVVRCERHDLIRCTEPLCNEEEECEYGLRNRTFYDSSAHSSDEDSTTEDGEPTAPWPFPVETRSSATRPSANRSSARRTSAARPSASRPAATRPAATRKPVTRTHKSLQKSSSDSEWRGIDTTVENWTALKYVQSLSSESDDDSPDHSDDEPRRERRRTATSAATEEDWTALNYIRALTSDTFAAALAIEGSRTESSKRARVAAAVSRGFNRARGSSRAQSSRASTGNRRSRARGSRRDERGLRRNEGVGTVEANGAAPPPYNDAPPAYETLFPSRSRR